MSAPTPAVATFKDLRLDAVDVAREARFWADVLGLAVSRREAQVWLTGPTPEHTLWINAVAEAHTVKNRVHLDVHAPNVAWAEGLGATVVEHQGGWTVMADPEGNEFCLFGRDQPPDYRLYEIVVDCVDPTALGQWWAGVLGARLNDAEDDSWSWVDEIPGAPFECLVFVPVPEGKTVKNRVYWDVTVAGVDDLIDAGAVLVRAQDDEIGWTVLADPEGNEFGVYTRRSH